MKPVQMPSKHPQLWSPPMAHSCRYGVCCLPGTEHLHPFASAAHGVAQHEEEDERHGGRDGQRDQEVGEIISGLQGLGRGVVFSKLGQDAGARFRAGDVNWDHLVDVNL